MREARHQDGVVVMHGQPLSRRGFRAQKSPPGQVDCQ